MRKRSVHFVLTAGMILSFSALIGCSRGNSENTADGGASGEPVRIWLPPFGSDPQGTMDFELWDTILGDYLGGRGIEYALEIVPWGGYAEKYLTAISSQTGPDVGYMYMEMIADFIEMGALAPMDEFITDDMRDRYIYLDNGVMMGAQYAFPFVVGNPRIMYYNRDILEANGISEPPSTWEEFVEVAKKIDIDPDGDGVRDIYPFIQAWNEPQIGALNESYWPFLWQAGGEIVNTDGTLALNSPEALEAARFVYDLRFTHDILDESVSSLSGDDADNLMLEGKVAFFVAATSLTKSLDDAGIDWGFISSLENRRKGTFTAVDSLVILSNAADRELAFDIITELTAPAAMRQFHAMSPFPPITTDGEEYLDNELFVDMYREDAAIFRTLPAVPNAAKIFDFLHKNLQLMMIGEMTPEETLDAAAAYSRTVASE